MRLRIARFAQQSRTHRRRRRLAVVLVAAVVAAVVWAVLAMGTPGQRPAVAARPVDRGFVARERRAAASLVSRLLAILARSRVKATAARVAAGAVREEEVLARLALGGVPVYCGGRARREVALTFDDGPSVLTPQFLRLLGRAHAHATFFVVGANLHSPALAAYMHWEAGEDVVGDHTWQHLRLTWLPAAKQRYQVGYAQQQIASAVGKPIRLFRPPYEAHNAAIDRLVANLGMVEVLWDVDSRDWAGLNWRQIGQRVLAGLRPGAIVLMHETRPQTLIALRRIILPELRARHLRAVTIPELLTQDPPSRAQLRAGFGGCLSGRAR